MTIATIVIVVQMPDDFDNNTDEVREATAFLATEAKKNVQGSTELEEGLILLGADIHMALERVYKT